MKKMKNKKPKIGSAIQKKWTKPKTQFFSFLIFVIFWAWLWPKKIIIQQQQKQPPQQQQQQEKTPKTLWKEWKNVGRWWKYEEKFEANL